MAASQVCALSELKVSVVLRVAFLAWSLSLALANVVALVLVNSGC